MVKDECCLPNTLRPDELVDAGVDTNILCAHLLLSEFANLFDCTRSTFLEAAEIKPTIERPAP